MAGINRRLPGTTLIETLVAMTLILITITLSFLSIISIKRSFNNDLRTYAYSIMNNHIEKVDTINKKDEIINYTSFLLKINREQFRNSSNLYIFTISAITPDSIILCTSKKIIRINSPEGKANLKNY